MGKTTVVNIFSKRFDHFIDLNLEKRDDAELFNRNLPMRDLFQAILLYKNIPYKKGKTLLFIDEIQNSPEAVSMLRYFYEEMPELFIISAGSLFEVMLEQRQISYPVGRVRFIFVYPLDFEEFLEATDEVEASRLFKTIPLPEYSTKKMFDLFHTYTLMGGMPEIILNYIKEREIYTLSPIYQSLLTSYIDDVSKYARNETMRNVINHCIESAPFEAGKRIVFSGFGNSNYKSREVGEALRILERAKLLYLLYPSTSTEIPILENKRKAPKLQLFDTGILNFVSGLQKYYFKYQDLHSFYRGILAEHIVGQQLLAKESLTFRKPVFWVREKKQSQAEVDFIIQYNELIIPVEVKSGSSGTLRSIHQFMNLCNHPFAVRLYSGTLKIEKVRTPEQKEYFLLNLPYFLTGLIDEYLEWFLNEAKKY